jgi:hypothetical protein
MFLAIYTEVRGTFDCCGVSGEMRGFFASLRMTIKNNYKNNYNHNNNNNDSFSCNVNCDCGQGQRRKSSAFVVLFGGGLQDGG